MKIYHICEVQDNTMNYIIMQDMKGKSKVIDWDLSEKEIEELVKEFEQVGGSLESRVGAEWEDDEECFYGKFAKRYLDI